MKLQLYDLTKKHIGEAHFIKRNGTVDITYNDKTHYADVVIIFNEYEDYKGRMAIQDEYQLGQMELFE